MPHAFGLEQIAAGQTVNVDLGHAGMSGVLLGNESGLTVTVVFLGANISRTLYPGTVDWFPVTKAFSGVMQLKAVANLSNTSTWPGSYVQIDVFGPNEAPHGAYPIALNRANNVGNTIVTSSGAPMNIVNDGSTAGTQIIEATTGADLTSAVILTNDGHLTLGNGNRAGSISSDNAAFKTDGLGNLIFGGKLGISVAADVLDAISTTALLLKAKGGGDVILESSTTEVARVTSGGILSLSNAAVITVNGPTSGTCKIYVVLTGTIKIAVFQFNNYQNNTGSKATFTLPNNIVINAPSLWISTDIPSCQGFLSGVGNTINIITSLSTSGGGFTNQNNIGARSIGYHQTSNTDSLKDSTNDGSSHTGQLIAIGF